MKISTQVLINNTQNWNKLEQDDLNKRIKGKTEVDVLEVYKMFMPNHFHKILIEDGKLEVVEKIYNFPFDEKDFEKSNNDMVPQWIEIGNEKQSAVVPLWMLDKALKTVLKEMEK